MAFTRNTFENVSVSLSPTGPQWKYITADAEATVIASAYFNAVTQLIDANQMIDVYASDTHFLATFTSAQGVTPVTTVKFVPA